MENAKLWLQTALVGLWVVFFYAGCHDTPDDCPLGTERCDCFGNKTCEKGLQCFSNRCVKVTGGDSDTDTDTDSDTDTDTDSDTDMPTDNGADSETDSGSDTKVGAACTIDDDCGDGLYCDWSQTPSVCKRPPTGQGVACAVADDCAEFEADYCEATVSFTCLQQGCSEAVNDCSPGYICCDFEPLGMGLPALCIDKSAGGKCAKGFGCERNADCAEGDYCDRSFDPPLCISPPFGQGAGCEKEEDCERNAADYCESMISSTCLMQGCDEVANDCTPDRHCCDFSAFDMPSLCVDSASSGGVCARSTGCESHADCAEGEYCDLTSGLGLCLSPPFGQGDPCESNEDCEKDYPFYADFCDADGSATCLVQGCDVASNNCSPGYVCCDLSADGLPTLCVEEGAERCTTESTTKNPPFRAQPKVLPFYEALSKKLKKRGE